MLTHAAQELCLDAMELHHVREHAAIPFALLKLPSDDLLCRILPEDEELSCQILSIIGCTAAHHDSRLCQRITTLHTARQIDGVGWLSDERFC